MVMSSSLDLPAPPGYVELRAMPAAGPRDLAPNLVAKRSWDIALGPVRQLPMNLLIMWMAGNTISIFPIMMVIMMFLRPFQALFSVQTVFQAIEGEQAILQRFVYLLGNVAMLGLAVYKCHTMGLLPTYASDWLAFVEVPKRLEYAAGGVTLQ